MKSNRVWFYIDGSCDRLFRMGELVQAGEELGMSPHGTERVTAAQHGRIVGIQFDMDSNQVILEVLPVVVPRQGRAVHAR